MPSLIFVSGWMLMGLSAWLWAMWRWRGALDRSAMLALLCALACGPVSLRIVWKVGQED